MVEYKKVTNSDKFRQAAVRFKKLNFYIAAPRGTTAYKEYWDEEFRRCIEGYSADDGEFITFGRNVLVGQGVTIMSSMVVGKYLIIKNVICGDYSLIGAYSTIAPGTIIGEDTFVSALSTSVYSQILEPGWIYIGIPCIKMKPNKYAESNREILIKRDVDEETKVEIEHEVNIDEDKKDLV